MSGIPDAMDGPFDPAVGPRPAQLIDARHDDPDLTGELVDFASEAGVGSVVPPTTISDETGVKPYYEDEGVRLYHGDALEILPRIRSAGCLLLDPPYHMSPSTFRGIDDGAASSIATPVRLLTETFRETYRLLPDGGVAFIFCDWRRGPDTTYLATLSGLRITTCVAWTRNRSGTGGMFRGAWDPIYVASKGVPSIRDKSAIPNVVNADHPVDRVHPYEKPARVWDHLLSRIPETSVVDAFAGSCTSADIALRHGHRWIGIEADERHCESAARRFDQGAFDFGGVA